MLRTLVPAFTAAGLVASLPGSAQAYVGPSWFSIPGITGSWKGAQFKGWVRADADYWDVKVDPFGSLRRGPAFYSGPAGPKSGPGRLVVGLYKDNPDLAKLMKLCARRAALPEMFFAERSDFTRAPMQVGPRPASIPAYFEYHLKDVQIAGCPIDKAAPQQAIMVQFKDVEVVNYKGDGAPVSFSPTRAEYLIPASLTSRGRSRSFVLTWFGVATDVSDDQCPVMNRKPSQDEYYALMPKEAAAIERRENDQRGGVNYEDGQMGYRGPGKLDVTRMPGVIADPGNAAPQSKIARGLDLDGDDGTGRPPRGIRKHTNYTAPDGRTGIDNQLFAAVGCIQSFQGHKGFIWQFYNNQMRDGMLSLIVEIVGIDDERNDDDIEIVLAYSHDPMAKSADGSNVLADYSFRLTDKPLFASYTRRLPARIVNGVIESKPLDQLTMNLGTYATPNELNLAKPRLRLEFTANGGIRGVLGGYMDWRPLISRYVTSTVENIHGFQVPGLFNALRRNADGLQDPETGEFTGISSTYDLEGIPVFLTPPAAMAKR